MKLRMNRRPDQSGGEGNAEGNEGRLLQKKVYSYLLDHMHVPQGRELEWNGIVCEGVVYSLLLDFGLLP